MSDMDATRNDATLVSPGGPDAFAVTPPVNATQRRASAVLPRVKNLDSPHTPGLGEGERTRYEEGGVLGEGGIGVVKRALDNDIVRTVAIKRLRPTMRDPGTLARFVDEIRMVGQLEHPNIVPIHDVGVDENGDYFFVMKYVEGETLAAIIERLAKGDRATHAVYTFERRVEIFMGICDALLYAHARGILHRDIKPANVMVGPAGEVMLMDWGLACRKDGKAAVEGEEAGTPLYMSPEQASGKPIDERSDIYSACVLMHELCTLRHFLADKPNTTAVLAGVLMEDVPLAIVSNSPHQMRTPADLSWFLAAGLKKDPAERYASVGEMIERLRARAEGKFPIQCHATFAKRLMREMTRFVDRFPVIFTLLFALSVLGLIALGVQGVRHLL